jgi:hypothetical protein
MTPSLFTFPTPGPAPGASPVPASSLSSRAMLCTLSISVWSARKHDPEVSDQIASLHGAQPNAGRYNKLLVPRESLEEIHKIITEARREHYFMTLPWADDGYRVLPAAAYMDHATNMRGYANRFMPAVNRLVARFETLVEQEKTRLGTLFKVEDYPGVKEEFGKIKMLIPEQLLSKFSFETKVLPLPDAGDFRVAIGDEERTRIQRQITAAVEASLQVASKDLWHRLYEAVSHMAGRLRAYKVTEDGVEHPFRDTVVTNLVKLIDVLPKLNVTNDADLNRLTEQVRSSLVVDVAELRKSESVRNETANAAEAIAQQMAGYMAVYSVPGGTTTTAAAMA